MQKIAALIKRSVIIKGRKTSVSLESPFWDGLKLIAKGRNLGVSKLVQEIYETSQPENLSSSIRLYVLRHYQQAP